MKVIVVGPRGKMGKLITQVAASREGSGAGCRHRRQREEIILVWIWEPSAHGRP